MLIEKEQKIACIKFEIIVWFLEMLQDPVMAYYGLWFTKLMDL